MKRWGVIAAVLVGAMAAESSNAKILSFSITGTVSERRSISTAPWVAEDPHVGDTFAYSLLFDTNAAIDVAAPQLPETVDLFRSYRLPSISQSLTLGNYTVPDSFANALQANMVIYNNYVVGDGFVFSSGAPFKAFPVSMSPFVAPDGSHQTNGHFFGLSYTFAPLDSLPSPLLEDFSVRDFPIDGFDYQATFYDASDPNSYMTTKYLHIGNVALSLVEVSPVPEPTVWATMLMGFGAIGTTMRGKRAKAVRAV